MTNLTPPTPPEAVLDADPIRLTELDRAQVQVWVQRNRGSSCWAEIPSPEERTSKNYIVCARLVGGGWIRIVWPRGGGGGVMGNRGGGRPPGRKNSKPRSDKGILRGPQT
jgi:hypothetical protein